MNGGSTFNEILAASTKCWQERKADEFLVSLAMPIKGVDPLKQLPVLAENQQFSFLWDRIPGLCIAATGQCQHLDLAGTQRFEVAQRFCDETFDQLVDLAPEAPLHALPRVLLAFSFFEQSSTQNRSIEDQPAVQAVLPRWQLTNQENSAWLRVNAVINHESHAREVAEHLWMMSEKLSQVNSSIEEKFSSIIHKPSVLSVLPNWQDSYRSALLRGIELVNSSELDKLVLAARQSITLKEPLDPLLMLTRLRDQQSASCRFLWKTNSNESFFGASPERLLSLSGGQIRIDALAGTANRDDDGNGLFRSEKNLREHESVVSSIINQLIGQGLEPFRPKGPQLAKQGHLLHLHTPIVASARGKLPLHLVGALHPTPAVAGLPQRKALSWLRALETFDRGGYAAPIGWIDSACNAEFRVAIRCGYISQNNLDLIAGAGLVKGSSVDGELQEVALKLAVLADQLDLGPNIQTMIFNRHSII
tara:strand:- start:4343 stop:5773 length:1431 start_codon:yes stop_codon:yes gene_type:complete